jgi:hypothetical protein
VFVEGSGGLLGYDRPIYTVLWQNSAGEFEVVESLLAGHPGTFRQDKLRLRCRCDVSGELSLGVQLGATLGGRDALQTAGVSEFTSIRDVPSFTVCRRVNARCRYANEQY